MPHVHLMPRLALLLALLAAPATAAAQQAGGALDLNTWNSRHYEIHSNLPRDEVIDYAQHMDLIYAEFARRFAGFRDRRRASHPLYLVRTREDYVRLLAGFGIDGSYSGGMFFRRGRESGLATWVERPDRSQAFATLRHEAFHQFAHNYLGRTLPTSINEGIAQYFENIVIVNGRVEAGLTDTRRIEQVKAMIEQDGAMPLDTLLNISSEQWHDAMRNSGRGGSDLYAQSWSLVYFLVHGEDGRFRRPFDVYLQQLSRGRSSRQAMQHAFRTDDFATAEPAWLAFAREQRPDPATTAQAHLEFLADGVLAIRERGDELPASFDALRDALRSRGFRTTHSSHGASFSYDANDDHVFQYEREPDQWVDFEMLEPADADEPPQLTAPHARWQPTLTWSRDEQDNLLYDITFQASRR